MSNKRPARWVVLVGAAATALVLLTSQSAAAAVHRTYSYEHGFSGWQVGYDGHGTWQMTRSTDQAYAGRYSIECYLDGLSGPGTAWLTRGYPAPMDTLVEATLTIQLWSPARSDVNRWPVVAYVGTAPPTSAADFEVVGYTDTAAGWHTYQFQRLQLTGQYPAQMWVAYGISANWEYARTYYMDQVTVSLTP